MSSLSEILPIYDLRIRTPNLLLRVPSPEEKAAYIIEQEKDYTQNEPYPGQEGIAEPRLALGSYFLMLSDICLGKEKWFFPLGVFLEEKQIGSITIWNKDPDSKTFASGYGLHSSYRGQGYGKEIQKGALALGFSVLGMDQSLLEPDIRNAPSNGLAQSLGYEKEGTVEYDGATHYRWLLHREDWRQEEIEISGGDELANLLVL